MSSSVLYLLLGQVFLSHSQELSETAQWSVETTVGQTQSGHCLLASGNFSLVVLERSEDDSVVDQINRTWVVPEVATVKEGQCSEQSSHIVLHWHDEDTGEENLLNLVISRKGRLAGLTGVFARLFPDSNKLEMSVQLDFKDFITLAWPLRYSMSCPQVLQFPLYPAPINPALTASSGSQLSPPIAFLLVENLKLEAFRAETLLDQYPESMSQDFYRRTWECEFHMTFDWAPIAVGGGLACLVGFMLGAFLCKSSIGCGDGREKYEKF